MTSGTPYIGSKISLISRAEIRYEGILYDVNSKEATVTLSKVRSYGTEDRPAPKPIPPRNEVYEYIIFRGSDIKDLSVSKVAKPEEPHQDPAIVSAQTASTRPNQMPSPSLGNHSGHSILPTPAPPIHSTGYTQFPPGVGGYHPFMPYFGRPPMMIGQPQPVHTQGLPPLPQQISSTTLSTPAKSSQSSLSSTTDSTPPIVSTTTTQDTSTPVNPGIPPVKPLPTSNVKTVSQQPIATQTQSHTNTETQSHTQTTKDQPLTEQSVTTEKPQDDRKVSTNRGGQKSSSNSPPSNGSNQKRSPPNQRSRRGGSRAYNYQNSYRGPRGNWRGGNYTYPNNYPIRGGGVSNVSPSNTSGTSSSNPQHLRYDSEFDFESANALFSKEELEEEIKKKLRIEDDGKDTVQGDDETPIVNERVEELEEGEYEGDEGVVNERDKDEEFYDKSVSFFDNISCESSQSTTNKRPNRSEEIALNTETFGVTQRGYSGRPRGYRGRSGNYQRGRGSWGYYNQYTNRGYGYNQYRGSGYYSGRGGYYRGNEGYYGGYGYDYNYRGRGRYQPRRNNYQKIQRKEQQQSEQEQS